MNPFELLEEHMADARAALVAARAQPSGVPTALSVYLDVEERIVLPLLDRCGPAGSDTAADALARHRSILGAMEEGGDRGLERAIGQLDAHLDLTRSSVLRLLHTYLDAQQRDDLAAAIVEADASREEADQPLGAPLEARSDGGQPTAASSRNRAGDGRESAPR